jgi:WD40 repeat protein
VQVYDVDTGKVVTTLPHPAEVRGLAWRGDGKVLATAAANSHVYLWDMTQAMPQAPVADLQGHQNVATHVAFSPAGDLLASTSWDGTTRLWDPLSGGLLLTCAGEATHFGPDGRFLAFKSFRRPGLWEVARGREYRRLPAKLGPNSGFRGADIHKDGRLLASAHDDGVALWDLAASEEIAFLPVPKTFSALFHPDGKTLITSGVTGVQRWPIAPDEMTEGGLRIGPPELLPVPTGSAIESASMTPDGRKLVVRAGFNRALVMDLDKLGESIVLEGHANLFSVAISPDGKWAATGSWHGSGVKVWDLESRKVVQDLPAVGSATVGFSPDGRWLVTSTGEKYRIYEVPTWKLAHPIARDRAGDMPGPILFTRDGKTLAIGHSRYVMQLLDPESGKPFATLEPLTLQHLGPGCFSPDGSLLVPSVEAQGIRVWDLGMIRRQLAAMKLDWQPPLELPPADRPESVEALKMRVVTRK